MPRAIKQARHLQGGLTLVELLVSITIGLVIVGAVSYMYVGSKGAYRSNESVARIQEAGRGALDQIARDLRRAGATGCGSLASITTNQSMVPSIFLPNSTAIDPTKLSLTAGGNPIAIIGLSPANYSQPPPLSAPPAGWVVPPNAPPYWAGDILQIQGAGGLPGRVSAPIDSANLTVTVADNSLPNSTANNFNTNDFVVLGDCSSAAVFQISGTAAAGGAGGTLLSYAGTTVLPTSITPATFPSLQHFDQVTYYVGQVPKSVSPTYPNGQSALYRYSMNSGTAEEVVDNVEDMDVVYGVDTSGTRTAGTFVHAPNVTDWSQVVSVRVSLITVGDQFGVAPARQTLMFRGTDPDPTPTIAWPAPDTRLRQIFTGSSALRDRLQ